MNTENVIHNENLTLKPIPPKFYTVKHVNQTLYHI